MPTRVLLLTCNVSTEPNRRGRVCRAPHRCPEPVTGTRTRRAHRRGWFTMPAGLVADDRPDRAHPRRRLEEPWGYRSTRRAELDATRGPAAEPPGRVGTAHHRGHGRWGRGEYELGSELPCAWSSGGPRGRAPADPAFGARRTGRGRRRPTSWQRLGPGFRPRRCRRLIPARSTSTSTALKITGPLTPPRPINRTQDSLAMRAGPQRRETRNPITRRSTRDGVRRGEVPGREDRSAIPARPSARYRSAHRLVVVTEQFTAPRHQPVPSPCPPRAWPAADDRQGSAEL